MIRTFFKTWFKAIFCLFLTIGLAYGLRMLEWPCWQNPEYRFGDEMLLATHDAYHWVAGACGFGLAVDHPMAIMLRILAKILDAQAANVAFWFPAVLASLVAGIVFVWTYILGGKTVGIAAGLIASIAPGFLARTLLGYYDTDLVTLFFPLLISLIPAMWSIRCVFYPLQNITNSFAQLSISIKKKTNPLTIKWICLLTLSGLLSYWCQQWHSVFPYLIRYNVVLMGLICLCLKNNRRQLLCAALAYALPTLAGWWGCLYSLALFITAFSPFTKFRRYFFTSLFLLLFWILVFILLMQGDIFETLINHANAYLKHAGDTHSSGGSSLIFPSVSQSIIEVQDLSFAALFSYFHPWLEASLAGFMTFLIVMYRRPAAIFLLPLAILGFSSTRLGGRMVMFGAPIVAIGISMTFFWIGRWLLRKVNLSRQAGWLTCLTLCGFLVAPFIDMIPSLSQGPIINRRHAAALNQAGIITPKDATLWLWWDWGYAAHYFARRCTIADGAQHGGPSLYLPAAVFATDNPRFARQIIRRTSKLNNEPGKFFSGLNAAEAQQLINQLRSTHTALTPGKGRQFIIASFEMLKLGFWISNFGNWNFITCKGEGGALSIVPQALEYNLKAGEVRLENNSGLIFPSSISVFQETGLTQKNYIQAWFAAHPDATQKEQIAWLATRRNINFLFNRVTDEKLAVDEGIYNSLMIQLLIAEPGDAKLAPYFKLVYDNVFTRIYEVLPAPEDENK